MPVESMARSGEGETFSTVSRAWGKVRCRQGVRGAPVPPMSVPGFSGFSTAGGSSREGLRSACADAVQLPRPASRPAAVLPGHASRSSRGAALPLRAQAAISTNPPATLNRFVPRRCDAAARAAAAGSRPLEGSIPGASQQRAPRQSPGARALRFSEASRRLKRLCARPLGLVHTGALPVSGCESGSSRQLRGGP